MSNSPDVIEHIRQLHSTGVVYPTCLRCDDCGQLYPCRTIEILDWSEDFDTETEGL